MTIALIQNVHVENMNLYANDFIAGHPSISGILGFAGYVRHTLGKANAFDLSVLPIYHDVRTSVREPVSDIHWWRSKWRHIELQPELLGSVTLSFVVDFHSVFIDEDDLAELLFRARIGGGYVCDDITRRKSHETRISILPDWDSVRLKDIDRGFVHVPAEGRTTRGYPNDMIGMLDDLQGGEDSFGKLSPTHVGYHVIDQETLNLRGVRGRDVPHHFAEPISGLSRFISVRSNFFSPMSGADLRSTAWKWSVEPGSPRRVFASVYL